MAIPRKSQFTKSISKMRGLLPIEKDLLRRIGEISDGAINNRGPTNPGTQNRRRLIRSPLLPPPNGLVVDVGPKSAKIEWNPVDSPVLLMYEAEVTNRDTNLVDVKFCFTNRLHVGGSGRYQVKVRSVSRSGDASPFSTTALLFTLQDDVLFLEGTGVGPDEKTAFVDEDIPTPLDYKVFAWGAINLGNFVDSFQNTVPVMDLSINGYYPIWSRVLGFKETALFSNLDDAGLVGEVRPGEEGRSGMIMTPLSWMFKPFYLTGNAGLGDTVPRFYMAVHNQQNDTAGTNLSLLSIPASIVTITEDVFSPAQSIELGSSAILGVRSGPGGTSPDRGIELSVGGAFTIGMWLKIPTHDFYAGLNWNTWGVWQFSFRIFDMGYYGLVDGSPVTLGDAERGFFNLHLGAIGGTHNYGEGSYPLFNPAYGGCHQNMTVGLTGSALAAFGNPDNCNAQYNCAFEDGWLADRQPNGVGDDLFARASGKWIFVAATYDSEIENHPEFLLSGFAQGEARKINAFWNGTRLEQRRAGPNFNPSAGRGKYLCSVTGNVVPPNLTAGWTSDNIIVDSLASQIQVSGGYVIDYATGGAVTKPMRLYWAAIWNGVLSDNAIWDLARNPEHDPRSPIDDYTESDSDDLTHWWVFGTNPSPLEKNEVCVDMGNGYPISLTEDGAALSVLLPRLKDDRPTQPAGEGSGSGNDSSPF